MRDVSALFLPTLACLLAMTSASPANTAEAELQAFLRPASTPYSSFHPVIAGPDWALDCLATGSASNSFMTVVGAHAIAPADVESLAVAEPPARGRVDGSFLIGLAAALATMVAFWAKAMLPLRLAAIAANFLFIGYGMMEELWPVLGLHLFLLPVNIYRLTGVRHSVRAEAQSESNANPVQLPGFGLSPV